MNFVSPFMLFGVAAAGIPIALHFFFRSRYRTVPWAAMKFLLTSIEQTSRRLKFQELLLLIVRCALLALLALALARPLFSSLGGSGKEAVDAVFVFDTSFSMGAREGKQTRLDFAKTAARKILDQLPAYSTVQVVTSSDRAELLGPREPHNLDQARDLIDKLELTDLATDLDPGVATGIDALLRRSSPNKELYVFSDMQKLGWEQKASDLTRRLKDLSEKAGVYLVRCGSQSPRNVAVVGIAPQSGIPRPGERVGFAVLVRNTGALPVDNLRVSLAADGREKEAEEQTVARLQPGETRAVTLNARLDRAGPRALTARVKQDDLDADNQFFQVIQVRDQVRVLVIDGGVNEKEPERSSSFFLMHALAPVKSELRTRYHVRTTLLSPRRAAADDLERADLCILVNTALERDPKRPAEALTSDFLDKLGAFVKKGGGLVVFGGDNVQADAYNRILGDRLGLLPSRLKGFATYPTDKPMSLDRNSIDAAALARFRQDEDYKDLSAVEIWKALDVADLPRGEVGAGDKPTAGRVLARFGDGRPALLSRHVGAGEVLLFATSAGPEFKPKTNEPGWNYLFVWPGYVPLIEGTINHLLARQAQNSNFTAGEPITWRPPPDLADAPFVLLGPPERPGGPRSRTPLGRPGTDDGRPLVTAPGPARAGVYTLTTFEGADPTFADPPPQPEQPGAEPLKKRPPAVPFAVTPDLRESASLEALSEAQLNERLGFRPTHLTAAAGMNLATFAERTNREWTLWLLLLVLLLAVGEMVLAWLCGRAW